MMRIAAITLLAFVLQLVVKVHAQAGHGQGGQGKRRRGGSTKKPQKFEGPKSAYFYINLARRYDRKVNLRSTISASSPEMWQRLERIDAVDGRKIDLEDDALLAPYITTSALQDARNKKARGEPTIKHHQGELMVFEEHLTEGAVACAMSHYKALTAAANHPTAEWSLILEDDVYATVPQVDKVIESLLTKLPKNWHALLLGYHGGNLTKGDGRNARILPLTSKYYGLYAWVVRKKAAKKLLKNAFPVSTQVDGSITTWLKSQKKMRAFRVADDDLLFHSLKSEVGLDTDIQAMKEVSRAELDAWNVLLDSFMKTYMGRSNPRRSEI